MNKDPKDRKDLEGDVLPLNEAIEVELMDETREEVESIEEGFETIEDELEETEILEETEVEVNAANVESEEETVDVSILEKQAVTAEKIVFLDYPALFEKSIQAYRDAWFDLSVKDYYTVDDTVSGFKKFFNQRNLDKLEDELLSLSEKWHANRSETYAKIKKLMKKGLNLSDDSLDWLLRDETLVAMRAYFNRARLLNPELSMNDVVGGFWQVMWMMAVREAAGQEMKLTDPIFGYALLPMYADYLVNTVKMESAEQATSIDKLLAMVRGQDIVIRNLKDKEIRELVDAVEKDYDRGLDTEIYICMEQMVTTTMKAYEEQKGMALPFLKDLLGASMTRSMTRSIARSQAALGTLKEAEFDFFAGQGMLEGFVEEFANLAFDLERKHSTIFTVASKVGSLDDFADKLLHFTDEMLSRSKEYYDGRLTPFYSLLMDTYRMKIMMTVIENKKMFSKGYYKEISKFAVIKPSYLSRLEERWIEKQKLKEILDQLLSTEIRD
ncbi:hypothetical protein SANA_07970 [Gottschalkiaceae bacterium SANA]|nr:hypothetical protein SANA_07970 [Gottschalkiaceae bacterium SANA]